LSREKEEKIKQKIRTDEKLFRIRYKKFETRTEKKFSNIKNSKRKFEEKKLEKNKKSKRKKIRRKFEEKKSKRKKIRRKKIEKNKKIEKKNFRIKKSKKAAEKIEYKNSKVKKFNKMRKITRTYAHDKVIVISRCHVRLLKSKNIIRMNGIGLCVGWVNHILCTFRDYIYLYQKF